MGLEVAGVGHGEDVGHHQPGAQQYVHTYHALPVLLEPLQIKRLLEKDTDSVEKCGLKTESGYGIDQGVGYEREEDGEREDDGPGENIKGPDEGIEGW